MFSLKQIEALYWIAQLGTFERAATRLHTTQSAISKRVHELEIVTGVPLFDRSQRNARLTEHGEQLLSLAEDMLALQNRVLHLKQGQEVPARRIRLGITELTALTWLPRLIASMRGTYPRINIETEVGMSRDLFDKLREDKIDLIIVPEAFSDRDLNYLTLNHCENSWMGSPKLIRADRIYSLSELAEHTVFVQGSRSGTGLLISRWLKDYGASVPKMLSCDSLIALLGLTIAGLGITYLPVKCFQPLIEDGKLTPIMTKPELPSFPYVAMYRSEQPSSFVANIAELAKSACDFSLRWGG